MLDNSIKFNKEVKTMVKATKATKQRLKTIKNTISEILIKRVEIADNIIDCLNDGFTLTKDDYSEGFYTNDCLYIKAKPWEKPYFRGLQTRYPALIQTTLTHSNNEIIIPDINKLVKAMLINR
jgi:hypothetical protein